MPDRATGIPFTGDQQRDVDRPQGTEHVDQDLAALAATKWRHAQQQRPRPNRQRPPTNQRPPTFSLALRRGHRKVGGQRRRVRIVRIVAAEADRTPARRRHARQAGSARASAPQRARRHHRVGGGRPQRGQQPRLTAPRSPASSEAGLRLGQLAAHPPARQHETRTPPSKPTAPARRSRPRRSRPRVRQAIRHSARTASARNNADSPRVRAHGARDDHSRVLAEPCLRRTRVPGWRRRLEPDRSESARQARQGRARSGRSQKTTTEPPAARPRAKPMTAVGPSPETRGETASLMNR